MNWKKIGTVSIYGTTCWRWTILPMVELHVANAGYPDDDEREEEDTSEDPHLPESWPWHGGHKVECHCNWYDGGMLML